MPAPKFSNDPQQSYQEIRSEGFKHEKNDCTVIALAKVCGIPYEQAHATLKARGRRDGRGICSASVTAACEQLGFKAEHIWADHFIKLYPKHHQILRHITSHHPRRFNKVWADGCNYLFFSKRHVSAVINGVNEDWSRRNALRVWGIYRITKQQQEVPHGDALPVAA